MKVIRMIRNKYYVFVLKRIMNDKEDLHLTGKQMSQINSLILKLENLKMKICLLPKENNKCRFFDKEKMECHNKVVGCGFQKIEKINDKNASGYVRKERWYEKYYKASRPKKG